MDVLQREQKASIDNGRVYFHKGTEKPGKKLSGETVIQIRPMYTAGCETVASLAKEFRVSKSAIHQVITRKLWKHV